MDRTRPDQIRQDIRLDHHIKPNRDTERERERKGQEWNSALPLCYYQ